MKNIIGILVLSVVTCTVANAGAGWSDKDGNKFGNDNQSWTHDFGHNWNSGVVGAPEIDPSSAISGLTLLLGGLTVLRGGRTRK